MGVCVWGRGGGGTVFDYLRSKGFLDWNDLDRLRLNLTRCHFNAETYCVIFSTNICHVVTSMPVNPKCPGRFIVHSGSKKISELFMSSWYVRMEIVNVNFRSLLK